MLLDAGADGFHDLQVDADQVVAAHAGLARHAGRDDAHVGARDRAVVGDAAARVLGVEAFDGAGLREVERLALGGAFHHVHQDDVAEILLAGEQSERAADLAGSDEGDFPARHGILLAGWF